MQPAAGQTASLHILDDMIEQQTYAVDAISGATSSSVGIKSAVKKALAASMEAGN